MGYVDIFVDKEPEGVEVPDGDGGVKTIYPDFYNEKPVKVANGDNTFHWHILLTDEQYAARKVLEDVTKPCDTFSECPKKYLTNVGLDEYRPKHVFGRGVHEPLLEVDEEPKELEVK